MPPLSPRARCALTAPFQPCLLRPPRRRPGRTPWAEQAVCFLWHFPSSHPESPLGTTLALWSPDFPPVSTTRPAATQSPPGSVPVDESAGGDHSSRTAVAHGLKRPDPSRASGPLAAPLEAALRLLFGLAPGGVYRAARVTEGAVRSCRTISTLPPRVPASTARAAPHGTGRRCVFCGTFLRVTPSPR